MPPPSRPAVFLDRDDTLIANAAIVPDGDLGDPALITLLPGALETCQLLHTAGYTLVVITNQGGVARGKYPLSAVHDCHDRLNQLLLGTIDTFRFCPYHPKGTVPQFTQEHPWRKPAPGMILDAADELDIDLTRSWAVGDKLRDCQAGHAAGCKTILLSSSPGDLANDPAVDYCVPTLPDVARLILTLDDRSSATTAQLTLSAQPSPTPGPLRDAVLRNKVITATNALAERTGVRILDLHTTDASITATIEGTPLIALGLAAQLRRITNGYTEKPLWGDPPG